MKLFGNKHGKYEPDWDEILPTPKDLSRDPEDGEQGEEIQEDYLEEASYEDEYDDAYDGEYVDEYDGEYDGAYEGEYDDAYDGEYDEDEDGDGAYDSGDGGKKRMSTKKKVLIGVLVFLVVLLGAVGLFINYLLNLINYQDANSNYFVKVQPSELAPEEKYEDSYLEKLEEEQEAENLEATPSQLEAWDAHLEVITNSDDYEVPISSDVYNILLLGSDTRVEGDTGRSDAMILVSLNQKTKTIYLTSFLRDCYVNIPGYGNTRLNHAFAYGGPALLEETLASNFKVHVDKYVAVDFFSFMDVIDTLDGVWINISEEERTVANKYVWSMNKLMGETWSNDYIWSSGWQKLNGKQALCYCRDRYTGSDYARTERQRNVINQIINGCMQASPATLVSLAQVILPQVTTDMEKTEILSYAANIAAYLDYDIQQQQIPYEGTYSGAMINGMSVISLNLDQNIQYLQNTIYAGTEYGE